MLHGVLAAVAAAEPSGARPPRAIATAAATAASLSLTNATTGQPAATHLAPATATITSPRAAAVPAGLWRCVALSFTTRAAATAHASDLSALPLATALARSAALADAPAVPAARGVRPCTANPSSAAVARSIPAAVPTATRTTGSANVAPSGAPGTGGICPVE